MSKIIEVVFPDSCPDSVVTFTADMIYAKLNAEAPPEPIIVRVQA